MAIEEGDFHADNGQGFKVEKNLMGDMVFSAGRGGKVAFFIHGFDVEKYASVTSQELFEVYSVGFNNGDEFGRECIKRDLVRAIKRVL